VTTPPPPPHEDHESFGQRLREAAYEAERETGRHEETLEEVRRGLMLRMLRTVGGFLLIAVGIAALPLPGPGWVIIIIGLSLLPYAWAERTIRLIRQKIPGVPEEGNLPARTWAIMIVLLIGFTTVSIMWGGDIKDWAADAWR
jgi:uncharacterized protein (TIGR02611 family)